MSKKTNTKNLVLIPGTKPEPSKIEKYNAEAFKQFEKIFNENKLKVVACIGQLENGVILTFVHPSMDKKYFGNELMKQANQLLVIARNEKLKIKK